MQYMCLIYSREGVGPQPGTAALTEAERDYLQRRLTDIQAHHESLVASEKRSLPIDSH